MLHMDEKQLKAINSKASRKKFIDHVNNNNVDKVNKMCAKGLDPNFHCQDSNNGGESKKDDDSNSSPSSLNFKSLRPLNLCIRWWLEFLPSRLENGDYSQTFYFWIKKSLISKSKRFVNFSMKWKTCSIHLWVITFVCKWRQNKILTLLFWKFIIANYNHEPPLLFFKTGAKNKEFKEYYKVSKMEIWIVDRVA